MRLKFWLIKWKGLDIDYSGYEAPRVLIRGHHEIWKPIKSTTIWEILRSN